MIGVNYTAFLIRDHKTGDHGAAVISDSQSFVTFEINKRIVTTPITQLAWQCSRNGWSFQVETSVHLFENTFADDEVGIDYQRDRDNPLGG